MTTSATGEPILTSMKTYTSSSPELSPPEKVVSAYDLWQLHKEKTVLRKEYLGYWEKTVDVTGTGRPVDAIISPVAPFVAPPHGMNKSVVSNITLTLI